MSVYTISNSYLDKYDPYWMSRLLALKVGTVAIVMCLVNMFLKAPSSPVTYMMTAAVGTLATELLPAYTKKKKLLIFLGIVSIFTLTQILFGLFSYFRFSLLIFVVIFSFLVLRFLAYNPKVAAIPTMMILWGFMDLEGGEATDLNAVINSLLYTLEYSGICGLAIWFFPSFRENVFLSGVLRILEEDVKKVNDRSFKNSDTVILGSINVLKSNIKAVPECFSNLYESIIEFQYNFLSNFKLTFEERIIAVSILSELINSIKNEEDFDINSYNFKSLETKNNECYKDLEKLIRSYNLCKV